MQPSSKSPWELMPHSLDECKIGRQTAKEIGFFDQLIDR